MKTHLNSITRCAFVACLCIPAAYAAAQFSLDWTTVDSGSGTSTGGVYSLSGSIGQPDAGTMSGGNFTLQGGFWGVVSTVQTPGAPWLSLTRSNAFVIIAWPKATGGWILEYRTTLTSGAWTQIPPPYTTNAVDCYISEPTPAGNKFYRLHKP